MSITRIVRDHAAAAMEEAAGIGYSTDEVGRALLSEAIAYFRKTRSGEDIAKELLAAADNVDPDTDYTFMRP